MLCGTCLARRHAVQTEAFTAGDLLKGTFGLIPELGPGLGLWVLGFGILDAALSQLFVRTLSEWPASVIDIVFGAATTDLLYAAVAVVVLARIEFGERLPWSVAWARVLRRLPSLIGINVAILVAGGVGFILCCLPGFAITTFWLLALPIAMREGLGAIAALQQSFRRMRPVFWSALGATLIASIPSMVFAAGSGVLAISVAERSPGYALLPSVLQALAYMAWLPGMVMSAVAYAKLVDSAQPSRANEGSLPASPTGNGHAPPPASGK